MARATTLRFAFRSSRARVGFDTVEEPTLFTERVLEFIGTVDDA